MTEGMIAAITEFATYIGLSQITVGSLILAGALSLGLALVIDKDTTLDMIESIGNGISDVAGAIGEGISNVVGSAIGGVFSGKSLWWLLAIGGGYVVYRNLSTDNNEINKEIAND